MKGLTMLLLAIGLITAALVLYTVIIFIAKKEISLSVIYWLSVAILFDTIGTIIMYSMREEFIPNYHSIVGAIALMSMILSFIGFTVIYNNNQDRLNMEKDPRLSIIIYRIIYVLWLSSYIAGFLGY